MSTRIDSVEAAPEPARSGPTRGRHRRCAIGDRPAVGLIAGGLLAGSHQQAASASLTLVAPSPAKVPALSWKDDYGTRHHVTPVPDGTAAGATS